MSKITLFDNYLSKRIVFYVNKSLQNIDDVQNVLRIKDYVYFSVVAVDVPNTLTKTLVKLFFKRTSIVEEILSCHYRYLVI